MKKKILLFITLMFTGVFNINAQDSSSKIRVYTPSSSSVKSTSKDNSYKWVVKTDLLSFAVGEFPISAEYKISKKFSIEASAGVTYSFIPNGSIFGEDDNSIETKAALGSAFRGSLKFYPSSDYDAIEGWFFGIQLFNKTTNREYNSDYQSADYSSLLNKKDTKTKTGISLLIGKQMFQDSNVCFETYIGVGMANIDRTYYEYDYDTSSAKEYSKKEVVPNLQLGFKMGFGN